MFGEVTRSEGAAIVCEKGLDNDSRITAQSFIMSFGLQRFMTVQMSLELNVQVASGMVHEDTTTTVHLVFSCATARGEKAAFGGANEVIHRNLLTRDQLFFLESAISVSYLVRVLARGWKPSLFAKLTRCTLGWMGDLAGCSVKAACGFRSGQNPGAEKVLNLPKAEVTKTKVPTEELLFSGIEVSIVIGDDSKFIGHGCNAGVQGSRVIGNSSG